MSKLKLCPFCGSEAELYAHTLGTFSIACKATDCNYHGDEGVIDDWCSMECETPQCSTVDEAREIWNTRALPPTEGKEEVCEWKCNGVSYTTSCENQSSTRKGDFCPSCGGKIKEVAK